METGTFTSLSQIHNYLFGDICDFAGKIRDINIVKGNFPKRNYFAPLMYLEQSLQNISKMPQGNFEQIIEKYVEMNIAHPFHEGNGRSARIWLDLILKKELGHWNKVDKEEYLMAMQLSVVKDIEIEYILKQALTDKINDREFL